MTLLQKMRYSVASLVASTACVAGMSAPAAAINFVPQENGEVDVGLECLGSCLDLDAIFASVVSLTDSTSGTQSRLFVDYFEPKAADEEAEEDSEVSYGSGSEQVKFATKDAGTNAFGYWFRPSEREALADGAFGTEETGQLEVGTYRFNFAQTLAELTIDFFDTETKNTTGVLALNGEELDSPDYVAKGNDGNVVSQTFYNVDSLVLKLGKDKTNGTGDGVNFRMSGTPVESVPEPAALVGLMAIAGLGFAGKKKASQAAS